MSGNADQEEKRFHRCVYLPVTVAVIVVLVTFNVQRVVELTGTNVKIVEDQPLSVGPDPVKSAAKAFAESVPLRGAEVSAHLLWGLSCLVVVLVLSGALLVAIDVIHRSLIHRDTKDRRVIIVAAIPIVVAAAVSPLIGKLGMGPAAFGEVPDLIELQTGINVSLVTTSLGVLAFVSIAALLLASSSTLLTITNGDDPPQRGLGEAVRRLQRLLYFGAAACVSGVFEVFALFRWPAALVPANAGDTTRQSISDLALSYSFAAGTLFTLILFAVYVPAALELKRRARAVALQNVAASKGGQVSRVSERDLERWLKRHGLHLSTAQASNQVMAVLGPLLAGGPLAALLNKLLS